MKSPFADCEATLMQETRVVEYRKESFTCIESFYRCDETGIEFTTTELDDKNIGQVYAQYREKYGIPSAAEITAIRKKYGLSAAKLSEILGLGINQYRLYEKGEMPSQSTGKMLALISDPDIFKTIILNSRNQYDKKEFCSLMSKINKARAGLMLNVWDSASQSGFVSDYSSELIDVFFNRMQYAQA